MKAFAKSKLTNLIPKVNDKATVKEVEELLSRSRNFKSVSYIYVVNSENLLVGSFPIKELFISDKETPVKLIANNHKLLTIDPDLELHKVALIAISNDLTALPVVDNENKFLGVITTEDIIEILDSKSVEQILRHGGINTRNTPDIFKTSILTSLKHRLPWLLAGLLGGLATAGIVNGFEQTLEKNIVLAMFIPLNVYMADAIGNQMEAFIIRDLNLTPKLNFSAYFVKQLQVIALIAVLLSTVIYIVSLVIFDEPLVSFVIAVGLFTASISSVFTGIFIPYLFSKLKFDPADASGPIATIIQDFSSLLIYFTIAALIL